jgi:hypothetical protein
MDYGVVKSPISFVIDFWQTLGIPYVLPSPCQKHYALYIELLEVYAYRT